MIGIREIDELVLRCADVSDIQAWCWASTRIREMCKSNNVWSSRIISIDSLFSYQILKQFSPFIDSLDLSDCDEHIVHALDGFDLTTVTFKGNSRIDDSTLSVFISRNCRNCKSIDISNCLSLTNKSMQSIADHCHSLESINVSGGLISFSGLQTLSSLKQLRELKLSRCILVSSDNLLTALSSFTRLKCLDLSGNSSVNYQMLALLIPMMPVLESLDIRQCDDLTGFQISKLKSANPQLKVLENAKIYDDSVESVRAYLLSMIRS
jgi:hypothetical protein